MTTKENEIVNEGINALVYLYERISFLKKLHAQNALNSIDFDKVLKEISISIQFINEKITENDERKDDPDHRPK